MKKARFLVLIIAAAILALAAGGGYYLAANWTEQTVVTDPAQYAEYFGPEGIHRNPRASKDTAESYLILSDIFPQSLPETADTESFYYEYVNRWDPCYLGYLVYRCSPEDFARELARLEAIPSAEDCLIYGAEGFSYPAAAVEASNYGYIYALADQENLRFIYVELTFCNYFTDIDYESVIPAEHLPVGFAAGKGNPARMKWEKDKVEPMDEARKLDAAGELDESRNLDEIGNLDENGKPNDGKEMIPSVRAEGENVPESEKMDETDEITISAGMIEPTTRAEDETPELLEPTTRWGEDEPELLFPGEGQITAEEEQTATEEGQSAADDK